MIKSKELEDYIQLNNVKPGSLSQAEKGCEGVAIVKPSISERARKSDLINKLYGIGGIKRVVRGLRNAKHYGAGKVSAANEKIRSINKEFVDGIMPSEDERLKQASEQFDKDIKFSILVPLYNTPIKFLTEMIDSCISQTYFNWELCLADGSDLEHGEVGARCKVYAERDSRVVYKRLEKNLGISENTNECIKMSSGDYIALFDHDDVLHPSALYEMMKVICEKDADYVYTDEMTFLEDDRYDVPTYHIKPDYSPDNLMVNNYICHFSVFKRTLIDEVGMFSTDYDGSQDHEIIMRLTSAAKCVCHIPKVLYFWRAHRNSVAQSINSKKYAITAGQRAVGDRLKRDGIEAIVTSSPVFPAIYKIDYKISGDPKVSIVIEPGDDIKLLANCVTAIKERTRYNNYEIVLADNENGALTKVQALNKAAKSATGDYLVFVDSKLEVINDSWLSELLMYGQRDNTGVVGGKLIYGNNQIESTGVIVGAGKERSIIKAHNGISRYAIGYMGRFYFVHNVSALSSAMMLVSKLKFDEVGGFGENYDTSMFDLDLCMKLSNKGLLNVCNTFAEAYHYENIVDGCKSTCEDNEKDLLVFKDSWKSELAAGDPYYNIQMSSENAWKLPLFEEHGVVIGGI